MYTQHQHTQTSTNNCWWLLLLLAGCGAAIAACSRVHFAHSIIRSTAHHNTLIRAEQSREHTHKQRDRVFRPLRQKTAAAAAATATATTIYYAANFDSIHGSRAVAHNTSLRIDHRAHFHSDPCVSTVPSGFVCTARLSREPGVCVSVLVSPAAAARSKDARVQSGRLLCRRVFFGVISSVVHTLSALARTV